MKAATAACLAASLMTWVPSAAHAQETKEIFIKPSGDVPGVAPEYQEAARKSRRAREKVAICQNRATDEKIMPRERTKFVLDCIDHLPD